MKKKIFFSVIITAISVFCSVFIPLFIALNLKSDGLYTALILLSLVLPCIIAPLAASLFAKKIVAPIKNLDPDSTKIEGVYTEIDQLIGKLRRQNDLIDRQMADLRRRQVEFRAITENMSEGLVILDNKSEILSYNTAAVGILGAENVTEGQHFISLCRSRKFVSAVSCAFEGGHGEANLTINQKVYQILANPVTIEEDIYGVVIVILDITEKEKRDEMRREFTSNVSHELKTPLTTISGISELLINSMVAPEDIPGFAKNIHDEARRLLDLINDIIKLSRLDEYVDPIIPEEIRLDEAVLAVQNRLLLPAAEQQVALEVKTEPTLIMGNPSILTEMIYNLTDNAIKYNKVGGSVLLSVYTESGCPILKVADTGIGIPPEHQHRIFERFYRVDKSHSKEVGGTGLGLSIVKHSAEQLSAQITLDSSPDKGTTITVTFPPVI
ncbi:MAG: ATP-binding protein [Acutalibacteraceae bacterium]|nr:ATP-binding protein [Acutalibacteraceae bacterium]